VRLPRQRDDGVCFRGDGGGQAVEVQSDGFGLPPGIERRGQTALLRLKVRPTRLGSLLDPFIEIDDGAENHRQYFERGARGWRYLNVSPAFQEQVKPERRVRLRPRHLEWQPEGSLLVFDPPAVSGASVLVVAPHPDDAEIAAFGLYSRARSPWVVTVTAGEGMTAEPLPLSGLPTGERARWHAELRVFDSLTIPQLGDVPPSQCVNLVFPDGQLAKLFREPQRNFALACGDSIPRAALRSKNQGTLFQSCGSGCTWDDLVSDLRLLLEQARPDIVVCPHPLIDVHSDHVFATVALQQAMMGVTGKPPLVLLYVVHSRDAPIYPFGPSSAIVGMPPWDDADWIAESLYSHPLPPELQRAKYFAVEAAHAVRMDAAKGISRPGELLSAAHEELLGWVTGLGRRPASLLRRAPRPNEVYFVVSACALSELVDRGLSERGLQRLRGA
jgi:LmbE family N-acetylglucosaminyl deacetylase